MIAHQAPREDRQAVEITDLAEGLDKLDGLVVLVEHELAARNTAVDVIDRTGNKQAGSSWHEIPLMRGRDTTILLIHPQPNKCGSVYVAPILDSQIVPIPDLAQDLNELDGLFRFREQIRPTREPVVDMVDPALHKNPRSPRHQASKATSLHKNVKSLGLAPIPTLDGQRGDEVPLSADLATLPTVHEQLG